MIKSTNFKHYFYLIFFFISLSLITLTIITIFPYFTPPYKYLFGGVVLLIFYLALGFMLIATINEYRKMGKYLQLHNPEEIGKYLSQKNFLANFMLLTAVIIPILMILDAIM